MDKDLFAMFMKNLGLKFSNVKEELFSCPACETEHKWGKCGIWCKMTCWYKVNGP